MGAFRIVTADLAGHQLKAKVSVKQPFSSEKLFLQFPPEWTRLYVNSRRVPRP